MPSTYLNYSNTTSPAGFINLASDATNGAFWPATIYMLFVVLLGVMLPRYGFLRSVMASAVMLIVISIPLAVLGAINILWMAPLIGFVLLAILYSAYVSNG